MPFKDPQKRREMEHVYAARHRERQQAAMRERRERHKATGLCLYCVTPVVAGRTLCARHLQAQSDKQRRYAYKISHEELLQLKQRTVCEICGELAECIDHDHETGKVRGMLCRLCNRLLGQARDDTTILANAIAYLERSHGDDDQGHRRE